MSRRRWWNLAIDPIDKVSKGKLRPRPPLALAQQHEIARSTKFGYHQATAVVGNIRGGQGN